MSLTPEQWRELDAAEKEWERLADHGNRAYFDALTDMTDKLRRHARTLIDVARPKCPTCKGTKKVMVKLIDGTGRSAPFLCEDCDGTGWAA